SVYAGHVDHRVFEHVGTQTGEIPTQRQVQIPATVEQFPFEVDPFALAADGVDGDGDGAAIAPEDLSGLRGDAGERAFIDPLEGGVVHRNLKQAERVAGEPEVAGSACAGLKVVLEPGDLIVAPDKCDLDG